MSDDYSPVAKRALNLLSDQCNDLELRIQTLATALRDIEAIAEDNIDLGAHGYQSIWHICHTGGVKTAMESP